MFSGHVAFDVTEKVGWERFPEFAERFATFVGGTIIKKVRAIDMCIWKIALGSSEIRLIYEDFPMRVCAESDSDIGDNILRKLARRLEGVSI
jgi:hypothetical protein